MYPIAEAAQGQATRIGMALSPAEDVLAISNADKGAIEVYSFPAMSLLRILGSSGSRPGHFHTPYKLCFSQAGTLLVVEHENDRVQEVTLTGGHVRYIGERTIRSPCAISVSRAGDLVAVTWAGHVSLFQFDTGALLRSIASSDVTRTFYGVCFTPDDLHLAVTRFKGDSVVNFLNLDGETLWSSVRLDSPNGVAFATNGDLLVCQNQHRMAVLSPDGKEVMRAIDFGAGPKSKRLSDTIVRYPFSLVMRENGSVLLLSQFGTHVVEIA